MFFDMVRWWMTKSTHYIFTVHFHHPVHDIRTPEWFIFAFADPVAQARGISSVQNPIQHKHSGTILSLQDKLI